ncbi:MAG: hypothetical protein PHS07_02320 [Patescibacteria group bacterium]|nr:hypothetical protein [Patescibacteria group bacterium]
MSNVDFKKAEEDFEKRHKDDPPIDLEELEKVYRKIEEESKKMILRRPTPEEMRKPFTE